MLLRSLRSHERIFLLRHFKMESSMLDALHCFCKRVHTEPSVLSSDELQFFRECMHRHRSYFSPEVDAGNGDLIDEQDESDEEDAPPVVYDEEAAQRETELARTTPDALAKLECYTRAIQYNPSSRHYVERATVHLDCDDVQLALSDANEAVKHNPDSAKALRLRARIHWRLDNAKRAYADMCEAQRIDYDDEYDVLHAQMKKAHLEAAAPSPPSPSIPTDFPGGNIDLASLMNNPQLMGMAQNMMSNPEFMQQMLAGLNPNHS